MRLFAATVAGAVVGSLGIFTRRAASSAERLQSVSNRVGVTAEELQKLAVVAQTDGVELEQLANLLQRFVRRLEEGEQGSRGINAALERLGLSVRELSSAGGVNAAFLKFADGVAQAKNESEALEAVVKILDVEGGKLFNTLRLGGGELRRLGIEADSAGRILDNELVAKGAQLDLAFTQLTQTLSVQFKTAILSLAGPLENLAKQIADTLKDVGDLEGRAKAFATIQRNANIAEAEGVIADVAQRRANTPIQGPGFRAALDRAEAEAMARLTAALEELSGLTAKQIEPDTRRLGQRRSLAELNEVFGGRPGRSLAELNQTGGAPGGPGLRELLKESEKQTGHLINITRGLSNPPPARTSQ